MTFLSIIKKSMDIDQFLDNTFSTVDHIAPQISNTTDIVVLNSEERILVNRVLENLRVYSQETMVGIATRIVDLERLSISISRYPSIHEQGIMAGQSRSSDTLIENLCKITDGDRMLSLPTKAVLGQGFLVAKFHAFSALTKVASNSGFQDTDIQALRQATLNVMFTIMAEDVYLALLDDPNLNYEVKRSIAESLANLWEHRFDQRIAGIAPVLDSVWSVRDKIAPNFGTMIGTSELLLITIALDETWQQFISKRLSHEDVGQSMEEFLFGISYEDICYIRKELKTRNMSAVGRDEIIDIIGHKATMSNEDPRVFYRAYTQRRNNAKSRKRLQYPGPKKTIEDHYLQFIFEREKELNQNARS